MDNRDMRGDPSGSPQGAADGPTELVASLARVKALFQLRTVEAIIRDSGVPKARLRAPKQSSAEGSRS